MDELREIEAIRRLKYRYFRCLDSKRWDDLAECFAEDAVADYDSGKYSFRGREEIIGFLRGALGRPTAITVHQGHHPEIDLTGPTTATGIWHLEDLVIDTERNTMLRGAAFYRDEYVKIGGEWKIGSTGYQRIFEEVLDRSEVPSLKITRSMFSGSSRSSDLSNAR